MDRQWCFDHGRRCLLPFLKLFPRVVLHEPEYSALACVFREDLKHFFPYKFRRTSPALPPDSLSPFSTPPKRRSPFCPSISAPFFPLSCFAHGLEVTPSDGRASMFSHLPRRFHPEIVPSFPSLPRPLFSALCPFYEIFHFFLVTRTNGESPSTADHPPPTPFSSPV